MGGIIMWSGTTAPEGWAICNGQTVNGYKTPDLSGKFIVSYAASVTDYSNPGNLSTTGVNPGNTGGAQSVTLQKENVPQHRHEKGTYAVLGAGEHSHTYSYDYSKTDGDESGANKTVITQQGLTGNESVTIVYDGGSHTHTIEGMSGNGSTDGLGSVAHENRPPYYVLAFIMRVR
ncbi:MAG TPA: hypothetical protein DEA97_13385 [Bacteroidales bacterium]|nr:hypothetical protein [Bacteroidales bacterium]